MFSVIAILLPVVIGLNIYRKKYVISNVELIFMYAFLTIISNFSCLFILKFLLGYDNVLFTTLFTMKYILFNGILSVIWIIIIDYFKKFISLDFKWNYYHGKRKLGLFIPNFIVFTLFLVLYFIGKYIYTIFPDINIEQLLYQMVVPIEGANGLYIWDAAKVIAPPCLFGMLVFWVIFYKNKINSSKITITYKKKSFSFIPFKISSYLIIFLNIFVIIFTFIFLNNSFKIVDFIKAYTQTSEIFENEYINPANVSIDFKDEKRNLIYLYLESAETTDVSAKNGGFRTNSLIPELENLALNHTNFSNSQFIGGAYSIGGTGWTIAGLVASTSGVPLKLAQGIGVNSLDRYDNFLEGVYSLGDILEKEGYNQAFIMGSNKKFAGRDKYLENHGGYKIYDYNWALENNLVSEHNGWWGYEDKKLFSFAKDIILDYAKKDEPFNVSLLTVDMHPYGGYLDESCSVDNSLTHYQNVMKCNSKMIGDFIKWIQRQNFYENTTIVIVGDHINMVVDDIYEDLPDDAERHIFNAIINSPKTTECSKNRVFNQFDMFPTVISALGASIDGNKLGLGTDLYSCDATIAEKIGLDNYQTELSKKSKYYNECIFYGTC